MENKTPSDTAILFAMDRVFVEHDGLRTYQLLNQELASLPNNVRSAELFHEHWPSSFKGIIDDLALSFDKSLHISKFMTIDNEDFYFEVVKILPQKLMHRITKRAEQEIQRTFADGVLLLSIPDIVADIVFESSDGWNSLNLDEIQYYIDVRQEVLSKPHIYGE